MEDTKGKHNSVARTEIEYLPKDYDPEQYVYSKVQSTYKGIPIKVRPKTEIEGYAEKCPETEYKLEDIKCPICKKRQLSLVTCGSPRCQKKYQKE